MVDAVISPGMANKVAEATPALRRAREVVREAGDWKASSEET